MPTHKNILIIDDEVWFVEPIRDKLIALGFEVFYQRNVDLGLKKLDEFTKAGNVFHAIIVDLMLPYGMGLEGRLDETEKKEIPGLYLITQIKKRLPDSTVYCYTVIDDPEVVKDIEDLGADHYAKATIDDERLFDDLLKH